MIVITKSVHVQNVTNVSQVGELEDILSVERSNNLELPAWTDPVFPDILYSVRLRAYQLYTETPYMTRIRGGPLVTEIFNQMVQKQNGELPRNISVYSAHDTTMNFVMTALNVINQTDAIPQYGATLTFELYCNSNYEENCTVAVRILFYLKPTEAIDFL